MPADAVADDAMLLRSYAADGDAAAFAELVRRYADMVYATARRVTGSAAVAEDVAQDCFLRLAQYSATITGSLAAWLHRTSLNRSLEVVRSERARKRRESAALSHKDEHDESRELIARVDEALASLPEELRAILTEHFLLGKSQSDLAAACGTSQSTISRRIDAALTQLRAKLRTEYAATLLPMLLSGALRETAPQTVRAAITKIGLSGVRAAPAAASGSSVLAIAGGATVTFAVIGAAWFLLHTNHKSPVPPASPAAAATPSATRPLGFLHKDEDDREEKPTTSPNR